MGTTPVNQWIIIATVLLQGGAIEELPSAGRFDAISSCMDGRTEMLVAYDRMIALEHVLADQRCAGSYARDRCIDDEFRQAVPWILLGNPRCSEVPTQ
jgi:hypothetical protein